MADPNRSWLDDAFDKGCHVRAHSSGMQVVMLVNEPGVFRNARGDLIAAELAEAAGFDTASLLKEKAKRDRIAQATALVEKEFTAEGEKEVEDENGGYKLVHIGFGRYVVEDEDGNRITPKFLTKEQAKGVLDGMLVDAKSEKNF